ncbi:MAG: iron-containing alcohol dehydrogenase [Clostridiales bacterium]|jgi:hypothetical protein|nr:iron-containing alcohol dehydrogenase [Clostridiales bacterium]
MDSQLFEAPGGADFKCVCGRTHALNADGVIFCGGAVGDGIAKAAQSVAPSGSAVFLISDSATREGTNRAVDKALMRAGYSPAAHIFAKPPAGSVAECAKIAVPENVRFVVGAGGPVIADVAKYTAARRKIPCILVPTPPFSTGLFAPAAALTRNGADKTFFTPPPAALVCDPSLSGNSAKEFAAAQFGSLVSKLVALFDWKAASVLNGEYFCPTVFERALALIDAAIQKSRVAAAKTDADFAGDCVKFSALCALLDSNRLNAGAEVQCARALKLLCKRELRPLRPSGENEFLFSRVIMRLYKTYLSGGADFFVPPPDNNSRLEKISEYLGLSEAAALERLRPVVRLADTRLNAYKLNEYRDELYALVCDFDMRLQTAWRPFKRLFPDDGYAAVHSLDKADVSLLVALAPDLYPEFTLLAYMKDLGLLDGYLY